MTKYRAVLVEVPDLPKPIQHFGNFPQELESWAKGVMLAYPLAKYPQARVDIYLQSETYVQSVSHPTPKEETPANPKLVAVIGSMKEFTEWKKNIIEVSEQIGNGPTVMEGNTRFKIGTGTTFQHVDCAENAPASTQEFPLWTSYIALVSAPPTLVALVKAQIR